MGQPLMPHVGGGLFWKKNKGEGHWTLEGMKSDGS